jgi:hypothetical protein
MGVRAFAAATLVGVSAVFTVCPSASAVVPVPTDSSFVLGGATADAWAPAILEPRDPWGTNGRLVPLINANYYDCAGCSAAVIRYPRTAGPLFGPCAPFADESIAIGAGKAVAEVRDAAGTSVISGLSLGAMTADAAQHALDADPTRPAASDLAFIVAGDPSRVTPLTTGIGSFLPVGFRIPVLGWTVTRPPSESTYDTVVVVGEYEWAADFPDRPWNLLADLNSLVAFNYTHSEASLTDPADVPAENIVTTTNGKGATTTTYLVPSPELPLLKPFDKILAPPVIAAANKVLKPMVDRAYSRYDATTGNQAPHLQPTDGLPKLVRPGAPAAASRGATVSSAASRTPSHTPRRPAAAR